MILVESDGNWIRLAIRDSFPTSRNRTNRRPDLFTMDLRFEPQRNAYVTPPSQADTCEERIACEISLTFED
jgi:hypothetical protein